MMTGDIRDEWRLNDIERKLNAVPKDYELYSLRSSLDSLEHSMRECRSEIDGFRAELSTIQNYTIAQLQQRLDELQAARTDSTTE